jgi:tetratricopeptide (TPR) repeat protein
MFTPKTRALIIIGCLLLAAFSFYQSKIYAAVVAVCFALITAISYFRQGTVFLAFRQLRAGKLSEADATLSLTSNTKWLSKTQKGYFYFVLGFIELYKKQLDAAKNAFEEALKIGLRLQNDTAMVYANLAYIHHQQKNKVKARDFIEKAFSLKTKEPVRKELERIKQMID